MLKYIYLSFLIIFCDLSTVLVEFCLNYFLNVLFKKNFFFKVQFY